MQMSVVRFLVFLLLVVYGIGFSSAEIGRPLPKWLDEKREKKIVDSFPEFDVKITPPPDFRTPAEYEPVYAVLVSYTGYTAMIKEIAKAVSNYSSAYVWVMSGPNLIEGVLQDRYVNFPIPIDSVWMRDYGPFGISKQKEKIALVDTVYRHYQYRVNDDKVPQRIASIKKLDIYPVPLILDGGNFMVDSKGNLYTTERTYIWNKTKSRDEVNNILRSYFKVKEIFVFEYAGYPNEPIDGTGHIDMFMKLLDDNTVLIADCEIEPFKKVFDKAADFFRSKIAPNGKEYRVLRVKSHYKNRVYYTYTNSLIVNGNVLMPIYSNYPESNLQARTVYESVGLRVIPINSDSSIMAGGSIHCVTQTIPDIGRVIKNEELEFVKSVEVNFSTITPIEKILNMMDNSYPKAGR